MVSVQPGTPLREGFSVVEGTHPLGPVLDVPTSILEFNQIGITGPDPVPGTEGPAWRAFLVVEDSPVRVWDDYVAQLSADVAAGGEGGAWSAACLPYSPSLDSPRLSCVAFGRTMTPDGGTRNAVLTMRSAEGDINAGYLLLIDVANQDFLGAYPDNPAGLPRRRQAEDRVDLLRGARQPWAVWAPHPEGVEIPGSAPTSHLQARSARPVEQEEALS